MLRREPLLMTLDEFMRMHDWYQINSLCRPNRNTDPAKGYFPVGRVNPDDPPVREMTFRELFMTTRGRALRKLGAPDEEVEAAFRTWFKSFKPEARMYG